MSDHTRAAADSTDGVLAFQPGENASIGRKQILTAAGGILGAIAASSCCILPLVLFSLGVSGAWIGDLTALAPYQPYFIALTFAFLGYGYCQPARRQSPYAKLSWRAERRFWWWENEHVPRIAGVPTGPATAWVPRSKPIWFTEYGFPTVNCATNQPNVFIDPKSIESFAPYYSNRAVDRVVQRAAIGGDSWLNEVPLGEETEEYDVLILNGANVVRTIRVTSQSGTYTAAQQTADFGAPPASLAWRVAQISRAYGRGVPTETISIL